MSLAVAIVQAGVKEDAVHVYRDMMSALKEG